MSSGQNLNREGSLQNFFPRFVWPCVCGNVRPVNFTLTDRHHESKPVMAKSHRPCQRKQPRLVIKFIAHSHTGVSEETLLLAPLPRPVPGQTTGRYEFGRGVFSVCVSVAVLGCECGAMRFSKVSNLSNFLRNSDRPRPATVTGTFVSLGGSGLWNRTARYCLVLQTPF